MSRTDWIALLLSIIAGFASFIVADRYFEAIPHLEDEMAYVWQARVIAAGDLTIETPELPKDFLVPFVVDHEGKRFGKYPLGWPVVLSLGILAGARAWVNPILAVFAVWLMYRLGQKLLGDTAAILAALLTATSPFFLVNGGSLLSHMLGLVLSLSFVIAWWDGFGGERRSRLPVVTAGLALGALALTRPFTAFGVSIPFLFHGILLLVRGPWEIRRRVLLVGGIAAGLASLHVVWQWAVTGDPFLNPYTLWWPYDKVGFGPEVGRYGHTLRLAWTNTKFSLKVGAQDLFGWGMYSWIFLPFGLWAVRRDAKMWATASIFPILVGLYLAYWVGAWLYGPRYQFESLFSLTLLSAAGIAWLAGWATHPKGKTLSRTGWGMARPLGVAGLVGVLIALNVLFYLPGRFTLMRDLYGVSRERLAPFLAEETQTLAPAVIITHPEIWTEYGALLEIEDPYLTTPFVFTFGDAPVETLERMFPGRGIYHYYPDEPYKFYTAPRPDG